MKNLSKGFLIAFEGIDGCGKTTAAQLAAQALESENYPVLLTREPGGTPLGKKIRAVVQHNDTPVDPKAEFLLFAADRAHHIATLVKPALENGSIVIADRLSDSSLAYQGYGRGLDLATIEEVNRWAMGEIKANLTIYIKVSVELACQRMASRNTLCTFEREKTDFFERIKVGFEEIYQDRNDVITIDGSQSSEKVASQALKTIKKFLTS